MDYTLEEYITIEAFNNMVLVERIEAINNLLKKFDIKRIIKQATDTEHKATRAE